MKAKSITDAQLTPLRQREAELVNAPSVEGFFELAESYRKLGLRKEADRLMQDAERFEQGTHASQGQLHVLMSGFITKAMVIELMQILNRTQLTGELLLENSSQIVRIYFMQGDVINAASSLSTAGFLSFLAAVQITHGTYRFVEKNVSNIERLFVGGLETMLLEAMQIQDETTHMLRQ